MKYNLFAIALLFLASCQFQKEIKPNPIVIDKTYVAFHDTTKLDFQKNFKITLEDGTYFYTGFRNYLDAEIGKPYPFKIE